MLLRQTSASTKSFRVAILLVFAPSSLELDPGDSTTTPFVRHLSTALKAEPKRFPLTTDVEARDYAYKWQVALFRKLAHGGLYYFACGGSLVDTETVLTAAHCVTVNDTANEVVPDNTIYATIGAHCLSDRTEQYESIKVAQVRVHPDYDSLTAANDVAVLRLSEPLAKSKQIIEAIAIADTPISHSESPLCVLTGWGYHRLSPSDMLQEATVMLKHGGRCSGLDRKTRDIVKANKMICVQTQDTLQSSCISDYGGPLVCRSKADNSWKLQGILSWSRSGAECASEPAFFTNISHVQQWIFAQTRPNNPGFASEQARGDLIPCTNGEMRCYSHARAQLLLKAGGLTIASSAFCSKRDGPTCTSLEQVRAQAINGRSGVIQLARISNCNLVITGGTEIRHPTEGEFTHWNGWVLNLRKLSCLLDFINVRLRPIGNGFFCDWSGNEYLIAANRVDVNYGRVNKCRLKAKIDLLNQQGMLSGNLTVF